MQINKYAIVAVLVAAVLGGGFFALRGQKPPERAGFLLYEDATTVAAGEILYQESCAVCHGDNLQGDPEWRNPDEDGLLRPPPHDAEGHTWHHTDDVLFELTKFGTAAYVGNNYQSNMIGYADILSDAEIGQVLAYIKSTWPPEVVEIQNTINEEAQLGN